MRILSMLNPAGAVIQAIIAIYNTIMFFRERLQQIIQVAESFFNSIAQIASGAIGAAADRVEQTMGRLVPVVISFLARLIGLGGISDTIRSIIARIRAPIDRALDRVVDWIAAQARRLASAVVRGARAVVARVTRWWASRKNFTAADGQAHSLFFAGEERSAVLKVRTVEMPFSDFVSRAQTGGDAARVTAKTEATRIAGLIDGERNAAPAGATPEALEQARAQKATRVNALLEQLAPHTSLLFGPMVPNSFTGNVNSGVNAGGFGTRMSVKPLTFRARPAGTPPTSANNARYAALNERRDSPGGASFYIKGHLLNQQLGGQGQWENLVPLSRSGNAQHERQAEAVVKRTVDLAAIVEYTVAPNFAGRSDKQALLTRIASSRDPDDAKRAKRGIVEAEDWVPTTLNVQADILDEGLQRRNAVLNQTIPNAVPRSYDSYFLSTTPSPVPVDLSNDNEDVIGTVPGIGAVLARRIVDARPTSGRFSSYEQIATLVPGIGPARLRTLESSGHIRLYRRG